MKTLWQNDPAANQVGCLITRLNLDSFNYLPQKYCISADRPGAHKVKVDLIEILKYFSKYFFEKLDFTI